MIPAIALLAMLFIDSLWFFEVILLKKTLKSLSLLLMAVLLFSIFSTGALAADGSVSVGEDDALTVTSEVVLSDEDAAVKAKAEAAEADYTAPVCTVSVDFGDGQGKQAVTEEVSLNLSTLLSSGAELFIAPPKGYYVSNLELSNGSGWTEAATPLLQKAHVVSTGGAALSLNFGELESGGGLNGAVLSAEGPSDTYTLSVTCSPITDTPVITYRAGDVTLSEGTALVEEGDVFQVEDGHPVRYPDLGALQEAYWQGKAFSGYLLVYEDGPSVAVSENSLILPYQDAELIAQWNDAALPHFTLTADSGTWEYDGAAHTKNSFTVSPNPAESGYTFSDVVVAGSVTSPAEGTVPNSIRSFVLTDPFNVPVTGDALSQMVDTVDGTLSVTPRSLTVTAVTCSLTTNGEIKTASSISTQDGVYKDGYHADNLMENHELVGDFVTGSGKETFPTAIDESKLLIRDKNTHETVDKAVFYSITTVPGKVTITSVGPTVKPEPDPEPKPDPKPDPEPEVHDVVVTLKSGTWTYDGSAHHQPDYEISGLVDGDRVKRVNFMSSSVITDVGTEVNDIQSVEIVTSDGKPVSDGKYKVSSRPGTLKVTARNVTVTAISGSLTTSGGEIFASTLESPDHQYKNGYKAEGLASGHTLSGSFVQGNGRNGFQTWIDVSKLTVLDAANRDVTRNYAIHTVDGYITINVKTDSGSSSGSGQQAQSQVKITVTAKSGSFVYDGKPHTLNGMSDYTVSGLVDGDQVEKVTFKSSSTITNVGTQNNEIQSVVIRTAAGAAVPTGKYNITYVPGKLTVTKFPLTLTAVSDSKTYDGKALNNKSVKSSALANTEHKLSADYEVYDSNGNSIKNGPVDVGVYIKKVSNVRITSGSQDVTANYEITMEDGTLTILTASGGTSASSVTSTAYYGNTYTIRSEAPYSEFQYLLIDGQKVPADQYTVKEGSTIITLKASYIQGLKAGSHNYSIVSTSRQADGSFTVSKAPKTSDGGAGTVLWILLLAALLLAALILWFVLRRSPGRGGRGGHGGKPSSGSRTQRPAAGTSSASGNGRGTAASAAPARREDARKKPVSDTVMDFETFFGSDVSGRPRKETAAREQAPAEANADHDPTKDLLPDFRIDLDAYREPVTQPESAAVSGEPAIPAQPVDAEADGKTVIPPAEDFQSPEIESTPAADEEPAKSVPDEAAPAMPETKAEKTVGELSMDEFLAGFSELMSESGQGTAQKDAQDSAPYIGRHVAGAEQSKPASPASGWYRTAPADEPDVSSES